jgi:hypothetical protein
MTTTDVSLRVYDLRCDDDDDDDDDETRARRVSKLLLPSGGAR